MAEREGGGGSLAGMQSGDWFDLPVPWRSRQNL